MKKLVLLSLLLLAGLQLPAQLFIDNNYTIDDMIYGFFDNNGVTISNVSYTGPQPSLAFFEGSQSNIGMNAGLLITSGTAENAVGPNDMENASSNNGVSGNNWLSALVGGTQTYDASVIEMDIVPSTDTLCFKYVFGSEEYLEYVNSQFNDVFAFLVEGPGFGAGDSIWVAADTLVVQNDSCVICTDTSVLVEFVFCTYDSLQQVDSCWTVTVDSFFTICGPIPNCPELDTIIFPGYWYVSPGGLNIALVPNTNLPVTINNLNHLQFSNYFTDNTGGATVQYDGFTTPLLAKLVVTPGETYHIRIAVSDVGDAIFDSGVFLGIESLGGDSLLPVDPAFTSINDSTSLEVVFDNNSFWATSYLWNFGDGQTSTEKNPTHTYAQKGVYNVSLTATNWCSSEMFNQTVYAGVTSAVQEPAASLFRVSPNPTNGAIQLKLLQGNVAQVRLTALDGRLLLDQQMADGARIDLNAFGKGLFQLQVISNGQVHTQKVVNR